MAKIDYDKEFLQTEEDFIQHFQETGVFGFDLAVSNGRGLPIGGCVLMY